MLDLQAMTTALHRVYLIANNDGSDVEFVGIDPRPSEAELQALAARWPGRGLQGRGCAGVIDGVPVVQMKEDPEDFLLEVRLHNAFALYVRSAERVAELERLFSLPDTRTQSMI